MGYKIIKTTQTKNTRVLNTNALGFKINTYFYILSLQSRLLVSNGKI